MFEAHGVPVLAGAVAETVEEARAAAATIGANSGGVVVVKAQVKVGGRGKAGGVKVAKSVDEAAEKAGQILGMDIKGHTVHLSLIHISEPTRRTPISYAVFCLKKKKQRAHGTQNRRTE